MYVYVYTYTCNKILHIYNIYKCMYVYVYICMYMLYAYMNSKINQQSGKLQRFKDNITDDARAGRLTEWAARMHMMCCALFNDLSNFQNSII